MSRIVVIGYSMVGHRFVEALLARDPDRILRGGRARRGAAPGVRPGRAVVLVRQRARWSCPRRRAVDIASGRARGPGGPRQPHGHHGAAAAARVRQPRARHRLVAVRAAGARPRPARLLRLPHDRRRRRAPRVRQTPDQRKDVRSGVVVGGGLLGLEAANALGRSGLSTHVVEFAPRLMPLQVDEGGGAMLRRHIEDLGVTVHTGRRRRRRSPASGRVRPGGLRRRRRCSTPTSSSSRPACGPATSWPGRRASTSASAAACWSTRPAAPRTGTSSRSASARRWAAGCTAWSRPATRWPRSSPTGCSAARRRSRRRHVDQAQAARRRRGQLRGASRGRWT